MSTSWNHLLARLPDSRRDVYFTEEYVKLYEDKTSRAVCFCCSDGSDVFLFPYLERRFEAFGRELYDFETAYGYGGPVSTSDDMAFNAAAWSAFREYASARGYVAGFIRFHPLLGNDALCPAGVEIIPDRSTVATDLTGTSEDVWLREIHTKNRNVIKKAVKNGLRFTADYGYGRYDDFKRLYAGTMAKLGADSFYYFSEEYFNMLRDGIQNSFLGLVWQGERIVAGAVFMYDGCYGHYHLSGSDVSALGLNPNNLLLWGAAMELKSRGVRLFHLGGGTDADPSNSLLAFKRKFSQNLYSFKIGKIIFNSELYSALCEAWERSNPDKVQRYGRILLKYKY